MASIQRRPDGRWRGRYRDQKGREHARHFDRKVDAQRWIDGITASQVRGDYVDPRLGRTSVSEYIGMWLPAQPLRDTSRRAYDSYLRNHVLPAFGDQRLAAVTRTQVLAFRRPLEERLAPITARHVMVMVAGIFADAVTDGVLARSPCADPVPRRPPRRRVVPLTAEEVDALIAAALSDAGRPRRGLRPPVGRGARPAGGPCTA